MFGGGKGGGVTILMVDGSHCKFWPIDLITVCNSIWSARQTCLELQCLYGNSMSNDFSCIKLHFLKTKNTTEPFLTHLQPSDFASKLI